MSPGCSQLLRYFDLSPNSPSADGMNYVSKFVSNVTSSVSPRLSPKRSRYGANRISDAGVYELSAALIQVSGVELLELPYNTITDQGARAIYD